MYCIIDSEVNKKKSACSCFSNMINRALYLSSPVSAFDIFTEDVQLVCKYLKAYDLREDCVVGIDKNYRGHLGKF